jgi:DNA-binding protein HU-beta
MNKTDLVAAVATAAGITKSDADKAVDGVFAAITAALKAGDDVRLVGFGTFSISARAAKQGRNPRTGDTIQIAASKAPKFSAGKALKDSIQS